MSPKKKQEVCCGCGAVAETFPYVGVRMGSSGWEAVPVCLDCWRDPTHRKTPIKAHFFSREMEEVALARAGSSDLQG